MWMVFLMVALIPTPDKFIGCSSLAQAESIIYATEEKGWENGGLPIARLLLYESFDAEGEPLCRAVTHDIGDLKRRGALVLSKAAVEIFPGEKRDVYVYELWLLHEGRSEFVIATTIPD